MIKEGTAAFQAWLETPVPVYTKFYFFDMLNPRSEMMMIMMMMMMIMMMMMTDMLNPRDLFHNHEKPILEERGPYVFR